MEDQPKRKRKLPKRYQESEDVPPEPERKVARRGSTSTSGRTRRKSVTETIEIDVVKYDEQEEEEDVPDVPEEDRRSELSVPPSVASGSNSQTKTTPKLKSKVVVEIPPRKKARKVVVSDSSEEDDYEAEDVVPEPEEEEDDYHSPEEEKPKQSKGKGKAAATASKGGKRKAKADPLENVRPALERKISVDSAGASKKKTRPALQIEDTLIDVVGDSLSTSDPSTAVERSSPATVKRDSPVPTPAPLKKLKLPTIKKTKLPGSGVATPTSATSAAKPKLPLEIGGASKTGDIRKTQRAGVDLDLSNKSIYQELFKTASDGGLPRSGLNRRSKEEERRKELNKMREGWKAKRATETVHSFDLQAQFEKISRFEEKLRAERSAALYPNFMAAKWREVYDREKRRQREQEWSEGVYANGKEEGEVK